MAAAKRNTLARYFCQGRHYCHLCEFSAEQKTIDLFNTVQVIPTSTCLFCSFFFFVTYVLYLFHLLCSYRPVFLVPSSLYTKIIYGLMTAI